MTTLTEAASEAPEKHNFSTIENTGLQYVGRCFIIFILSDCETPVAACSGWADPVAGFYAEHDFRQNH